MQFRDMGRYLDRVPVSYINVGQVRINIWVVNRYLPLVIG